MFVKTALLGLSMWVISAAPAGATEIDATRSGPSAPKSVLDFQMASIDGKPVRLDTFRGDVLLIVNVASKCGLTKQNYKQLEPLYRKYKDRGFSVLAFPANNFGGQEPGSNKQVKEFCARYDLSFPLFAKVSVKGDDICDLYRFITESSDSEIAGPVRWNFQKYLVDRNGKLLARFSPRVNPDAKELTDAIEAALKTPRPSDAAGKKG